MCNFKALAAVSVFALSLAAPAAYAQSLTKFATTTDEDFSYNAGSENFNITGSQISDYLQFSNLPVLSGQEFYVNETLNGGSGVNVLSATDINGTTALTLGAFTLTYAFASPVDIDGVYVSNLLTLNVGAGTVFDYSDVSETAYWNFSVHAGNSVTFTSDILRFVNVVDEAVTFSFSDVSVVDKGTGLGGFDAQGSGNFSSNPLPQVPEPISAALLVVGMTVVGVASRRRRSA